MATFLWRSRTHAGSALGKLLSGSDQLRSRSALFPGRSLGVPEVMGWWKGGGGGALYSSRPGGAETWQDQWSQRPRIARWGDWACLGLTALAGGLYWTSDTPRDTSMTKWLPHMVLVYGALRYSLKRKLLRLRVKWFREKLILNGIMFQESEREYKACLDEVGSILEDFENALSCKRETIPLDSSDPILISAFNLLQRIDKLRVFIIRNRVANLKSLEGTEKDLDFLSSQFFLDQLSKQERRVRGVVSSHATNQIHIIRNKELLAKVDNLLVSLDKEK